MNLRKNLTQVAEIIKLVSNDYYAICDKLKLVRLIYKFGIVNCREVWIQPVPDDILNQFNAVLDQKNIPLSVRDDCLKWLKYCLNSRVKYPPLDAKSVG